MALTTDLKGYVTGPAVPVVGRIRNQYLMEVLIKLPKESGKSMVYKKVIRNHISLVQSEKKYASVSITPDVDPM
jgi:primosomal protein N' (replication factor Y)